MTHDAILRGRSRWQRPGHPFEPAACFDRCPELVGTADSCRVNRWNCPGPPMPGSRGWILGNGGANIRLCSYVGLRGDVRLIPVIGQTIDQFPDRCHIDRRGKKCRLAGIQDHLLRPFARGCNPDGRHAAAVRPIGKPVRQLRQRPAGHQKKNRECAPNNRNIFYHGQSRLLRRFRQSRSTHNVNSWPLSCHAAEAIGMPQPC